MPGRCPYEYVAARVPPPLRILAMLLALAASHLVSAVLYDAQLAGVVDEGGGGGVEDELLCDCVAPPPPSPAAPFPSPPPRACHGISESFRVSKSPRRSVSVVFATTNLEIRLKRTSSKREVETINNELLNVGLGK